MKRYIRTKYGKIFDLKECCKESENTIIDKHSNWLNEKDIIKQSDNIENLIMVGDLYTILLLVDMGKTITEEIYEIANESDLKDFLECIKMVRKLYTKHGNDYILVARKEDGEWRVL